MASQRAALTLIDIPWLRLAARRSGALDMPQVVAAKLLAGGLVERDITHDCLKITARGQIALDRLA
jgi:hypothetical protein